MEVENFADEEYLDESLFEEEDKLSVCMKSEAMDDDLDEEALQSLESNICIYCNVQFQYRMALNKHMKIVHDIDTAEAVGQFECELCEAVFHTSSLLCAHLNSCHGVLKSDGEGKQFPCHFCDNVYMGRKACYTHLRMKHGREFYSYSNRHGVLKSDGEGKQFPCHFCDNVYMGRKACYTHLRMKHGLKLSTDTTPRLVRRERKKCHICDKDFSQKQILNRHLWKEHGCEVAKRKAFVCPLCDDRVSYGHNFELHLLTEHRLQPTVQHLEFPSMDDFTAWKAQMQEDTKCRFRKTTASKQTIEGLRSHYMCSQSGMYVYQGKGIRPAPERQIYKTGKACPAHMLVTETSRGVTVAFHSTHVGHGVCPYYKPREPKKMKHINKCMAASSSNATLDEVKEEIKKEEGEEENSTWICDTCGVQFSDGAQLRSHAATHGVKLFPCHYCDYVFQNVEAWTRHLRVEHNIGTLF